MRPPPGVEVPCGPEPAGAKRRHGGDRGSGSVLALAIVLAAVVLAVAAAGLGAALAERQQVVGAADAAALAAADVASGAVDGDPCTVAAGVANANGSRLAACRLDGLVADVRVARALLGVVIEARARAGPPP